MVEYYQLSNIKIPRTIWSEIAKDNQFVTRKNIIQARIDSANELGRFVDCIVDLLDKGYVLNRNFQFITANIEE